MKLHWSPRSPFVRKVMICAHELDLAGRIDKVRTMVRMTEPNAALLADNPLSKIPTLVLDDGTTIFDSLTICEYLDHLAGGGKLFPRDPNSRFLALTRHALANGLLDMLILWAQRARQAAREANAGLARQLRDQASRDASEARGRGSVAPQGPVRHRRCRDWLRARLSRFPLSRYRLAGGP